MMPKPSVDKSVLNQEEIYQAIVMFFEIIEQVVESEHKHQFPVRRDFWLKYFNRGMVQDAWVVLGSKAQEQMRRFKLQNDGCQALKWAKLSGGPSDECALLIQLDNIIAVELRGVGVDRLWRVDDGTDRVVPAIGRSCYKWEDLRGDCPQSQIMTGSNLDWRYTAADRCIERLSGQGN